MSEVKRYYAEAVNEHALGALVSSKDYDALAAQRDEGLAREAELRTALAIAETYVQTAFARARQKTSWVESCRLITR